MGRTKRGRGGYGHSHRLAPPPAAGQTCFQHKAAAAAPAPNLPDPRSAADSDEDDEAAEFRREAAELLRQRQQRAALPGGLSQKDLDSAVRAFTAQTGVDRNQAEDALLSTAEEHCKDFEEWLNQAFMWLAIQSEVQDEADKLKEAMQVSLREQEAARLAEASGPPLAKLSEERLRKKFQGSAMLTRLGDVLPGSVLFSDRPALREKVKNKLIEFLGLEANCHKWWPGQGTQQYFSSAAERFFVKLQPAVNSSSRGSATDGLPAAAGAAATSLAAAGKAATDTPQQALAAAAGPVGAKSADPPRSSPAAPAAATDHQGLEPADGPAPAAPAADPAVRCALPPPATGSCHPSPEAEAPSEPGSSTAADSCTAEDDGGAAGQRASKRRRQAPARYRSASPAASADSSGKRKRQQRTPPPEEGQPAKRQASVDCHAAAAKDSSSPLRSASPSPGALEPPAGQTAAAAAAGLGGRDSMQQQDRGVPAPLPAQQPSSKLPPLPPQQQLPPAAAAPAAAPPAAAAAAAAAAGCQGGCGDPLEAYLPAAECLSELFDGELQLLRHHVYTMPDKAGALPTIFQLAGDQLQEPDGEDSDVELVDVKHPAAGQDIPQSPELPAPPLSPPAPLAPAAGAAAAAAAAGTPDAWQAAFNAAAAASAAAATATAQAPSLDRAAAAAAMPAAGVSMLGGAGPGTAHAAVMGGYGQLQPLEHFEYKATTNEEGTLVIEID